MRRTIDPGKQKRSINIVNDVPFSTVRCDDGSVIDLKMTLLLQNGNSEMRLVAGIDNEVSMGRQPVIVWINGNGWRSCPRTYQAAESVYLADAGFAVAVIEYRNSSQAKWSAQLEDVRQAVRFLKASAEKYNLDPDRIGAIGRSAGGHLASFLAMNIDPTAKVNCAADFFGPVDLLSMLESNIRRFGQEDFPFSCEEETREGVLLGGGIDIVREKGAGASPINFINDKTAPILILHGDQDPLVPISQSDAFYDKLTRKGIPVDYYIVEGAGHGTREFVQPEIRKIVLEFFERNLKES